MVRKQLADKLKYFRELNKMTIYEVGEQVGKSGKTISAWENGRGQPDADMLLMLCEVYNIKSISELYGESPTLYFNITATEEDLIKKFREIDARGKDSVLQTLEREYSYINKAGENKTAPSKSLEQKDVQTPPQTIRVQRAAKSDSNKLPEIVDMPVSEIEELRNAPKVTSMDDI